MSYVWSAEMVARYVEYYQGVTTRGPGAYLTFATSAEYARSVLPPCLEVADDPQITLFVGSFMEIFEGYPNRPGRDTAALIGINARYGGIEGSYFLTVIETEEVNVTTGREIWGMPKKIGSVDAWDDGKKFWSYVERKGHRLVEMEAEVGPEVGPQEDSVDYYFELRGRFAPDLSACTDTDLVVFEMAAKTFRFRELTAPHVTLSGSPFDRGLDTIELGDFVEGGLTGGETGYHVAQVVDLHNDGYDYRPYLLGRFYDAWEDYEDREGRQPSPTTLGR